MRLPFIIGVLLFAFSAHADFQSMLDYFRDQPSEFKVFIRYDQHGRDIANLREITVQEGDHLELLVFKGAAFNLLKLANLDKQRARGIRSANYFNEIGTDVFYDQRGEDEREQALAKAERVEIVAGETMSLLALHRLLAKIHRFTSPNDGITWMRDYSVPQTLLIRHTCARDLARRATAY